MGKLIVKNGTPVGSEHLCRTCSNGQFTVGYRDSEVLVICTNSGPARLIPFPVYECTGYWDRNRPSYDEMRKLALNFSDYRRKPITGFRRKELAQIPVTVTNDPEDEDEAAVTR